VDHIRHQIARQLFFEPAVCTTALIVVLILILVGSPGIVLAETSPRDNVMVPQTPSDSRREAHKFHVSYSRMGVEGKTILVRVRFFTDDLREAIRKETRLSAYIPEATPRADSIFTAYFNANFKITIADSVLIGQLAGSGEEEENGQAMNWYLVQYESASPVTEARIDNTLLAKTFDDQKNILKIQQFPSEKTRSFFFEIDSDPIDISFDE